LSTGELLLIVVLLHHLVLHHHWVHLHHILLLLLHHHHLWTHTHVVHHHVHWNHWRHTTHERHTAHHVVVSHSSLSSELWTSVSLLSETTLSTHFHHLHGVLGHHEQVVLHDLGGLVVLLDHSQVLLSHTGWLSVEDELSLLIVRWVNQSKDIGILLSFSESSLSFFCLWEIDESKGQLLVVRRLSWLFSIWSLWERVLLQTDGVDSSILFESSSKFSLGDPWSKRSDVQVSFIFIFHVFLLEHLSSLTFLLSEIDVELFSVIKIVSIQILNGISSFFTLLEGNESVVSIDLVVQEDSDRVNSSEFRERLVDEILNLLFSVSGWESLQV